MSDSRFEREFLRNAFKLATASEVHHFLYICDQVLTPADLRGLRAKKKLVYAVSSEALAQELASRKLQVITVPPYDYSRTEKIKVVLLSAISQELFKEGDLVLCAAGRTGKPADTLMYLRIGATVDDRVALEGLKLGEGFNSKVIDTLIQLALQVGQEGFEGHPVGTLITVGDHTAVLEKSRQLTINPFQGLSESERNVLDPRIRDAVKNFSVLDGAFVIREDGVVLAAGRYLSASDDDVRIPLGLGARHAAAASISATTQCVALVVSQSSGAVRVFREGNLILELHQTARRN